MTSTKIFRVTGYSVEDGPVNMHCCYCQADGVEQMKGFPDFIIDAVEEVTLQDVLDLVNHFVY